MEQENVNFISFSAPGFSVPYCIHYDYSYFDPLMLPTIMKFHVTLFSAAFFRFCFFW